MSAKVRLNRRLLLHLTVLPALVVSVLTLCAQSVPAEVYSWTDESGSVHFTDDQMSIPPRYKGKVQRRDDGSEDRSWEYLASDSGADYLYDTSHVSYISRNRYRVITKESYAYAGREEYETQIILDCARQTYKPVQSVMIYKKQRGPAEIRGGSQDNNNWGGTDGFRRLIYPFQLLARIICRDAPR